MNGAHLPTDKHLQWLKRIDLQPFAGESDETLFGGLKDAFPTTKINNGSLKFQPGRQ